MMVFAPSLAPPGPVAGVGPPLGAWGAVGEGALLLERDLRRVELPGERVVLALDVPQIGVGAPDLPRGRESRRDGAFHFGEHAEGHGLEDRHAGARIHLSGDQHHVPQHHAEEQVAGSLTDVENRHS